MDNFIISYYKENLNKIKEKNSPPLKYINFRNLNYDQKIFQLSIEIKISENLIIKTKIDWNLNDEKKSPEKFSSIFVDNLIDFIKDKNLLEFNKTNIKNQIFTQLIEKIIQKIDMVGADLDLGQGMCGSSSGSIPTNVGQPMIRVTEITVGGR